MLGGGWLGSLLITINRAYHFNRRLIAIKKMYRCTALIIMTIHENSFGIYAVRVCRVRFVTCRTGSGCLECSGLKSKVLFFLLPRDDRLFAKVSMEHSTRFTCYSQLGAPSSTIRVAGLVAYQNVCQQF